MENRGINSSTPCISHERNFAYLKPRAGQKILAQQYPERQSWHRAGAEALQIAKQKKHMKRHEQHEKAF